MQPVKGRYIGAAAVLLATLYACSTEPTAVRQHAPTRGPAAADVVPSSAFPEYGEVRVCNQGNPGSYTVSATGGNLLATSFNLTTDFQCVTVWQSTSEDDAQVTVTQTGASGFPTVGIVKYTVDPSTLGNYVSTSYPGLTSLTVTLNPHSGHSLWFKNKDDAPPPPKCTDMNATNYGGPLPCTYPPPKCTDLTATNYGGPLPCTYPPPGKTFTIGPSSMEGHLKIAAGTWFNGGYSFKFISSHIATQFTVTSRVDITVTCPYGGGPGGTITIPLGTVTYNVPAGNATDWLPTGDANNILSWMGAVHTPDLCGGFLMDNAKGAVFTATVSQNPPSGSLADFRFKYRNPAAKGKTDTNCTDPTAPKRNDAATCGASWSQTVRDP